MRVLIINKFLYPNGGSETYIFKLGEALEQHGHEVQYFGMEHEGRCVGNRVNAYTSDMDFHGGSKLSKLTYPIKTIYSKEARVQLRKVLDDFKPDVCHLNNFNYQLTPSIILEIVKWRKETGRDCKIIFTAHDYQLVCPNHMLNNPNTHQNCEKCLGGHFVNCMKGKCIHGSTAKSAIGMMEAEFWKWKDTYKYIDTMICCSEFMKSKMDSNPLFATKTVAMHNFIDKVDWKETEKNQSNFSEIYMTPYRTVIMAGLLCVFLFTAKKEIKTYCTLFFAFLIMYALMEQEVAVCMTNFARIMNELNNAFSGRNEVVDRLCGYPLLVIDDFGMERGTEYALEQINCILVKDLSRFGRNYIEVGRYLERIFPVMRVRLIAVTDNYDSQSAWKTSDSIMVPMRNLLNDAYCRDISVKIKSQLAVKRKRGDFVGSFARKNSSGREMPTECRKMKRWSRFKGCVPRKIKLSSL